MDGLSRAVGAGTIIEWEGNEYVLEGLNLEDYGILKNFLLEKTRQDKIDFVLGLEKKLPAKVFEKHLDKAIEDGAQLTDIPDEQLDHWLTTLEGGARSLWLLMDRRYPGKLTYQNILAKLKEDADKLAEVNAKRDMATGVDRAGNLPGLDEAAVQAAPDAASIGTK